MGSGFGGGRWVEQTLSFKEVQWVVALGEGDGFWRHLGDMGRTDGDEVSMWCLEVCIEADESNTGRARRESSV
jgi:hypothetical protein